MASERSSDGSSAAGRKTLALLPLRDIVIFPHMVVPLFVGRPRSIAALHAARDTGSEILLTAQRGAKILEPGAADLFEVGTVGHVIQILPLADNTVKVLVEGKRRARIHAFLQEEPYFRVDVEELTEHVEHNQEVEQLMATVRKTFAHYASLTKRLPPELLQSVEKTDDPARLADLVIAQLPLKLDDKQAILEMADADQRLRRLVELMNAEIDILEVERRIRSRVREQLRRGERESDEPESSQARQGGEPANERDELKNEIDEIEEKLRDKKLTSEAEGRVRKELKKLRMMSPMSAEATVVRNYIDWILSLPWMEATPDNLDIERAEQILDEDHYGLKKPKERILEYLAVQHLVRKIRGPILCLVGPPGVGKTSLARSIAKSTNRRFVRISLGGVRDEAEIRGHRRTYIGAMPGKIVQAMKKAGSSNPVVLLDEIDKMSMDFRGDPSSALLEVLDPEQNATFNDHYLDLDYDLSEVLFITTANGMRDIPLPLQDRMEIIEVPGYTEFEKLQIAKTYLLSKQREANGLADVQLDVADAAIQELIHRYTREAGVRNLEREIAAVCRKIARQHVRKPERKSFRVTKAHVHKLLGPPRFEDDFAEERDEVGLTHGLAWTIFGGVVLTAEVTLMPGSGKLIITGKLGDVMQESAQAALSYVRSRALNLGLAPTFYQKVDIHVHFPEGAAPKDGPSAGITMVTSIVSALTRLPVRADVAMTGEITLRGRVLPIGGLKEKLLAAHRAGVKRVIIPKRNEKDLEEVPRNVLRALEIVAVEQMDQVLENALRLEDPAAFAERLRQPILPPEIRAATGEAGAPSGAHGGQDLASAQAVGPM